MSCFDYKALHKWPDYPAQGGMISAFPEHANVSATYCAVDEYGDVGYESEIPLRMRNSVPLRVGPGLAIYGMVAEPANLDQSKELLGKDLVLATWPTSRGWLDRGVFKMGYKDGQRNATPLIEEEYRNNPRALRDCLMKLNRNPYDTRKNVATAVLIDPYCRDGEGKFILGRDCYYGATPPMKLIAVCDNFDDLRSRLLVCDLMRDMLEATFDKRDLFLRYNRSLLHKMAVARAKKNRETFAFDEGDPSFLVFEEIASEELANKIMQVAVEIALAGPEDLGTFRASKEDENGPAGRKLAKHRARDVFIGLYWNLWKRLSHEKSKSGRRGPGQLAGAASASSVEARRRGFLEAVEFLAESLDFSSSGLGQTVDETLEQFQESMDGMDTFIREGCGVEIGADIESDTQEAALDFCLRCGAIFRSSHRPRKLVHMLEELSFDDNDNIAALARWSLELSR